MIVLCELFLVGVCFKWHLIGALGGKSSGISGLLIKSVLSKGEKNEKEKKKSTSNQ